MNPITTLFKMLFNREPFRTRINLLRGKAGVVTDQRPCGCVLKAEHQPDKHLWTFQLDYSKCKQLTEVIQDIIEVANHDTP